MAQTTFPAACKPRLFHQNSLNETFNISHFQQMALETATPSAFVVGNAFVEQYYRVLYDSPELAHRFYHDSSVLSRPDSNGVMTSVTTMQGINEKILSLDYKNYKAEINTADAQKSYKEGDNGYFVLNDVLRYVEDGERESLENQKVNGVHDAPRVPSAAEHEPTQGVDPSPTDTATSLVEENQNVAEQASDPSDKEIQLVNEKEALPASQSHSNSNDMPVVESASSAQEDTQKKSYASIVKVPKGSSGPTRVYVPTNSSRMLPPKTESQPPVSPAPAPPEASTPSSIDAHESNDIPEEVEGHSIYIKNLPFNVTPAQLEQEFKKFGPIKQGGVQVRNNKQQGYCFGFVEFLSLSSMNDAIQLVVKEASSHPEEEVFEMTASGVVEIMLVTEALAETNLETMVNFLDGLEVQLGAKGEGEKKLEDEVSTQHFGHIRVADFYHSSRIVGGIECWEGGRQCSSLENFV
ncbi:hypothetical protein V6N12_002982 [Hibiscus sabdariffa]|uniref:Uncharacterized protein n=1 Tax=Hibiscus sabdariffa TaxID=183260 RepID=A0ABR2ECN7_9ROSI